MPGGKGTRSHTPAGPRRLHGPPARGTPAAPPLPGPSWEVWLPTPPSRGGGFSPAGTALAGERGGCAHLGIVDTDKAHG